MIWAGIRLDLDLPQPQAQPISASQPGGEHMRISAYRYPSLSSDHLQLNTNNLTYFNFRKIQMENSFLGVLQRFPVIRIRPSSELTLTRVSKVSNISFQSLPPPLVLHKNYCVYCNLFTASKRYNCCQKMMRYVDMHS